MNGADKGLQLHRGQPLALRGLQPQVGSVMLRANRNLPSYRAMGVPVWPDSVEGDAGPLAALVHTRTQWLVSVPCDTPNFPTDLVARLAAHVKAEHAEIAMAAIDEGGRTRAQPVFCLLRTGLRDFVAASVRTFQGACCQSFAPRRRSIVSSAHFHCHACALV